MALNGVAHILGTIAGRTVSTVRFARPMPGFWLAPVLIVAAIHVIRRIREALGVDWSEGRSGTRVDTA